MIELLAYITWPKQLLTNVTVNEILGEHNVEKQISDSRGDVSIYLRGLGAQTLMLFQCAYLMADISSVQTSDLRDILDSLEALSCKHRRSKSDIACNL